MRDSMVFYRSFADAIRELDQKEQLAALWAVIDYALDGKEPEGKGSHKAIYRMAKPQIDANIKRYINGTKGGRKKNTDKAGANQTITKTEPSNNQNQTESEPNVNENDNENVNEKEKQIMCKAQALFERLWKIYPVKKGKGQVSDTQKKRLLAIGEAELVKAIERYSSELQKDADWRKPQNGSTFFNSGYVDYLDENYVPADQKPKKSGTRFNNFEQRESDYGELERQLLEQGMEQKGADYEI